MLNPMTNHNISPAKNPGFGRLLAGRRYEAREIDQNAGLTAKSRVKDKRFDIKVCTSYDGPPRVALVSPEGMMDKYAAPPRIFLRDNPQFTPGIPAPGEPNPEKMEIGERYKPNLIKDAEQLAWELNRDQKNERKTWRTKRT